MIACPNCAAENLPGAKFCNECGASLALKCSQCSYANQPGSKFCNECGSGLRKPSGQSLQGRFDSPQDYTPRHLAQKILTSRAALEGERKQVTVLFADIKGSLELLADRDPEEAQGILDPVLALMMEAVHRYEGTVCQVMGDGVMALFGAPLAHEDHAVRACYAALAMQAALRVYSEQARRAHGIEVQVRVGVNSGEVVVRAISNDLTIEYSAVGQTTHLAARLEQLATPGSTRISSSTLRLAEGFVQVRALGLVPIKGLIDPVEVFELTGASALRTRMQAAAARGLTKFVGRTSELDVLSQALARAGSGRGQVAALVGEPGVGKSRLVWEFSHSHRTAGWLVLESGSMSYGKASAYRPLIDLLYGYFQISEVDDVRRVREKVTGKLLTLDRAMERALPAFLMLLDVPSDSPEWQVLHPAQRRQRTLDALKTLFLRESQVQPLLLVFEDLHWIDEETQALLDSVVDSVPNSRLLLLVNYRREYRHGWANKAYYTQLQIDPLPAASSDELLAHLLGDDTSLEPLKKLLVQRTEGNPFFLEESVRGLSESGVLTGERGAYVLTTLVENIQVPGRVQAVLAARIDRLDPEAKRLLQIAAVIGKDVPYRLLEHICDRSEEQLRDGLANLQGAEFLYETALFPDLEYTFRHALTHDVAYGGMLHERRRATHATIVDAMERVYADRLTEQLERLANHAVRGEVWNKAVTYLQLSGAKALARSANHEATALYERALEALKRLPETRENLERAIDLRVELRNALHPLGEFDRVVGSLREAESAAQALGDERRLGRVYGFLAQSMRIAGSYKEGVEIGAQALHISRAHRDLNAEVTANFHLGQIHFALGEHELAEQYHRRNIEIASGEMERERMGMAGLPSIFSRGQLVWSLSELGRFREAVRLWEEGMRIAREANHPFSIAFLEYAGGYLYLRAGDIGRAISWLERGLAHLQSMNIRLDIPLASAFLGACYAVTGRVLHAMPLLEQAVSQVEDLRMGTGRAWLMGLLAEACAGSDQRERARGLANAAVELARERGERGWEAWGLKIAADVEPPDVAHELLFRAIGAAEDLGLRPLRARCEHDLGRLFHRLGDAERARHHLQSALDSMTQMDMGYWRQAVEVDLSAMTRDSSRPAERVRQA